MNNIKKNVFLLQSPSKNSCGDLRRHRPIVSLETMRRLRDAGFNGPVGFLTEDEAEEYLRSHRQQWGRK